MLPGLLYVLFFLSGISGLVYQVIWVRAFGNVFGNTVYSTSVVVAIFMLGLGVGSCIAGAWADRRHARAPESLLRAYGWFEVAIAALGVAISLTLPHLSALSALSSSYVADRSGWFVLSPLSYVARGAIAFVLLTPITMVMGGTLTLLIRHRVRNDVETAGGWKIGVLYGVNTLGAAAGAFLTDFVLVPAAGLLGTQMLAVTLNAVAGIGALAFARGGVKASAYRNRGLKASAYRNGASRTTDHQGSRSPSGLREDGGEPHSGLREHRGGGPFSQPADRSYRGVVVYTALALALTGFVGMGMEILWLRHFNLLLGGFRTVFSLVLTIMLAGIGVGSLVGGVIARRSGNPAEWLMRVQALFVIAVLGGLASADISALGAAGQTLDGTLAALTPLQRWLQELWYNARPILLETGAASLLMGCSFPLANAVVQHAEGIVGQRAGVLYLANTAGAVCGSLITGYVLLPALGIQHSATVLMVAAALTLVPLFLTTRRPVRTMAAPALLAVTAVVAWLLVPADFVLRRSLTPPGDGERVLDVSEGVTEIISVTEKPGLGRALLTNNHAMASDALLDQRYMRALAHIPLLAIERPTRALVIGFGVGNSTHAATLHPSIDRVDVVDLSRHVLQHAAYFRQANGGVLGDPRVAVYVNDGRQHLHMQPAATYDLITLEPPPIAHAGVAALYSRQFYELARTRLKSGGYISQWLPAYQVPAADALAMVRAFIDVFPQSVLLSGMQAELLLVGTTGPTVQIDPERLASTLEHRPTVLADLRRIDLGSVREIIGTFVGSAATLARATHQSAAVTDDRPLQEYGVRSVLGSGLRGVPAALFDLAAVTGWCPKCFDGNRPAPAAAGLDTYLALLDEAYGASADVAASAGRRAAHRTLLGSAYLGAVVPDTAEANGSVAEALVENGQTAQAIGYLLRAVQLDPDDAAAQHELGSLLLERGEAAQAAGHFRAALRVRPDSAAAHNDLGVALADQGGLDEAIEHFKQAVNLEPGFEEARRNLASALRAHSKGEHR